MVQVGKHNWKGRALGEDSVEVQKEMMDHAERSRGVGERRQENGGSGKSQASGSQTYAEVEGRACGKVAEVKCHPPSSKNISKNLKIGSYKQLSRHAF